MKEFKGVFQEAVKISSDEFYNLGGFSNPNLFRNDKGHFKYQDTAAYKQFKKDKK